MSKFKVGDKVRILPYENFGGHFGISKEVWKETENKIGTIIRIIPEDDYFYYKLDIGKGLDWLESALEKVSKTIYASDLMTEARKNPEKYEGKQYKVMNKGHGLWANGSNSIIARYDKCIIKNGLLTAGRLDYNLSCDQYTQLEEIKPEPKPVPVEEAVKAHLNKQTIRCILNGKEHVYTPYYGQMKDKDGQAVTSNQLLNGTWCIEEEVDHE